MMLDMFSRIVKETAFGVFLPLRLLTTSIPGLGAAFLFCSPVAASDTLQEFKVEKATFICQHEADTIFFGGNIMEARNLSWITDNFQYSSIIRVPLLAFDLSEIPPQTPIKSAKLKLPLYNNAWSRRPPISIFPIVENWDHKSVAWITKPEWDVAFMDCTFEARPEPVPTEGIEEFDITPLVQKWVDDLIPNHGLALFFEPEEGNFSQGLYHPSNQAVLEVSY
jgi:hypothetical protein